MTLIKVVAILPALTKIAMYFFVGAIFLIFLAILLMKVGTR